MKLTRVLYSLFVSVSACQMINCIALPISIAGEVGVGSLACLTLLIVIGIAYTLNKCIGIAQKMDIQKRIMIVTSGIDFIGMGVWLSCTNIDIWTLLFAILMLGGTLAAMCLLVFYNSVIEQEKELTTALYTALDRQGLPHYPRPYVNSDNRVYEITDEKTGVRAEFPGGEKALKAWMQEHIAYPPEAAKDIHGKVVGSIIIGKDGSIEDILLKRPPHEALGQVVKRAIRLMPKWRPAILLDGKIIRYKHPIDPIEF